MTRRLRALAAAAAAVLAFAGGLLAAGSSVSAAPGDSVDPYAAAVAARAGCQAWLDKHPGSNTLQATRMRNCVADQAAIMQALTAPSPAPSTSPSTSPSASPTATAGPTTAPPTTTPPASPTPSVTPTGAVTHGSQINAGNTGYLAWPGVLGQRCTDANLTVYPSKVNASQLGNATCVWLKQGINVDQAVTLTAARIDTQVDANGPRLTLNWSTVDAVGDEWAVGGHVDTLRSQLSGASDGVRFYGTNLVETLVQTHSISAADHNDGIQAYLATEGGSILRCNINATPDNAPSGVWGNATIFLADRSTGEVAIRDNELAGGGYTLRLHESMHYRVTGNVIAAGTWLYGPLSTDNAVAGAFLEWDNNTTTAGVVLKP